MILAVLTVYAGFDLSSDISLRRPASPIKGTLILEYGSRAYLISSSRESSDKRQTESMRADRGTRVQNMLLAIRWDHITSKKVNLTIQVHPSHTMATTTPKVPKEPPLSALQRRLRKLDTLLFKHEKGQS